MCSPIYCNCGIIHYTIVVIIRYYYSIVYVLIQYIVLIIYYIQYTTTYLSSGQGHGTCDGVLRPRLVLDVLDKLVQAASEDGIALDAVDHLLLHCHRLYRVPASGALTR